MNKNSYVNYNSGLPVYGATEKTRSRIFWVSIFILLPIILAYVIVSLIYIYWYSDAFLLKLIDILVASITIIITIVSIKVSGIYNKKISDKLGKISRLNEPLQIQSLQLKKHNTRWTDVVMWLLVICDILLYLSNFILQLILLILINMSNIQLSCEIISIISTIISFGLTVMSVISFALISQNFFCDINEIEHQFDELFAIYNEEIIKKGEGTNHL